MGKSIKVNDLSYLSSNLGHITYVGINTKSNNVLKITAKENLILSFSNNLIYNDGSTESWKYYEANTELELNDEDIVVFKGSLVPTEDGIGTFTVSGNFEVSGKLLALINNEYMKPYQFKNLFKNCTTLIDASNLIMPKYTVQNCYEGMFFGCTSLISSPKLIAEILTEDCYKNMFYGCSSLSNIVCYNVYDISEYVLLDWINGVASSGIFEINYNGNWNNINKASHIPENWTINNDYNYPWENEYMQLDILTDGTILWKGAGSNATYSVLTISYSKDNGTTWTDITATSEGAEINVVTGDKVLFKGNNTRYAWDKYNYSNFGGTSIFEAKGNIMSLLYGDNFIGQTILTNDWALSQLFNNSNIVSAEYLIMPATTITNDCYRSTFANCQLLTKSPKILPATTLKTECYYFMFQNCPLMTTHPELPAEILISHCYEAMFRECSSLTTIKCLAKEPLTSNTVGSFIEYGDWHYPTSGSIFYKHPSIEWPTSDYLNSYTGVPSNWIIKNYKEEK